MGKIVSMKLKSRNYNAFDIADTALIHKQKGRNFNTLVAADTYL
jgi:hypothetical protein